jgi:hypothetical protein
MVLWPDSTFCRVRDDNRVGRNLLPRRTIGFETKNFVVKDVRGGLQALSELFRLLDPVKTLPRMSGPFL